MTDVHFGLHETVLKGNESRSGSISIGGNADPLASLAEDEQYVSGHLLSRDFSQNLIDLLPR